MTIQDLRRVTAICVLETAFWAPFFFVPLAAGVMVHVLPGGYAYAHALYATVVFAVVGAYFRRTFLPYVCLHSSSSVLVHSLRLASRL